MNPSLKSWVIGVVNAGISGLVSGGAGLTLGIGWQKSAVILGVSAMVSLSKWMAQHPIPGGAQ
jgi:hypothetical protein